jgi:hypothetical protein
MPTRNLPATAPLPFIVSGNWIMVTSTVERVMRHTVDTINQQIMRRIADSVRWHAALVAQLPAS